MLTAQNIVGACWIAWLAYWLITWRAVKPAQEVKWGIGGLSWYVIAAIILFFLLRRPALGLLASASVIPHSTALNLIGVCLAIAGLVVTIWARATLGRNWSARVELKVNPELVTTGIYRYMRHPIYSGIFLMAIGTVLVMGTTEVLVVFLVAGGGIIFKLTQEERLLTKSFPNDYPAYKRRTKALIPFVL